MATILTVNFKGVNAAQGSQRTDHIEPGTYRLEVVEANNTPARTGKPMATIFFKVAGNGREAGKRLVDRFVTERLGDEVPYPLERLKAMLESCDVGALPDGTLKLDLDKLIGRSCVAEVYDETYEPDNGPPRLQSRIGTYFPPKAAAAADEGEGEEEEEEAELAPAPAPKAKAAAKAKPKAAPVEDDNEDEDEEGSFPF